MCPHLWDIIEDAAASGSIDLTACKEKVLSCDQCKRDVVALIEKMAAGVTGTTAAFMVGQAIAMLKKAL